MRPSLGLFALVLTCVLAAPKGAFAAFVQGTACGERGETHASDDADHILACLELSPSDSTLVWKSMTGGVLFSSGAYGVGMTSASDFTAGVFPDVFNVKGNLRLGAASSVSPAYPSYGQGIVFGSGSSGDNTDSLWIARMNSASNKSELRINLGDDAFGSAIDSDTFVVGVHNYSDGLWYPRFAVDSAGNAAVSSTVQIGDTAAACGAANAGAIRYSSGKFEGCDGTSWGPLGGGCSAIPTEIDAADRGGTSFAGAATTCRNLGSCWHLPSPAELIHFIGMPGATGNLLWTREYSFMDTAGGPKIMRLNDGGSSYAFTFYPGSPAGSYAFRCVR